METDLETGLEVGFRVTTLAGSIARGTFPSYGIAGLVDSPAGGAAELPGLPGGALNGWWCS